jgi:hypothetical protein
MRLTIELNTIQAVEGYIAFKAWLSQKLDCIANDDELWAKVRGHIGEEWAAKGNVGLPDILAVLDSKAKLSDENKELKAEAANLKVELGNTAEKLQKYVAAYLELKEKYEPEEKFKA